MWVAISPQMKGDHLTQLRTSRSSWAARAPKLPHARGPRSIQVARKWEPTSGRQATAVILRLPPAERFGVKLSPDLLTRVRREYPRIRVPCQDGRGRREGESERGERRLEPNCSFHESVSSLPALCSAVPPYLPWPLKDASSITMSRPRDGGGSEGSEGEQKMDPFGFGATTSSRMKEAHNFRESTSPSGTFRESLLAPSLLPSHHFDRCCDNFAEDLFEVLWQLSGRGPARFLKHALALRGHI